MFLQLTIEVISTDRYDDLKAKIYNVTGSLPQSQSLFRDGHEMMNSDLVLADQLDDIPQIALAVSKDDLLCQPCDSVHLCRPCNPIHQRAPINGSIHSNLSVTVHRLNGPPVSKVTLRLY